MAAAREFRRPGPKRHERSAFARASAEEKMPDEGPTTESS